MEKYFIAGQATDNSMAHVHCMLDNTRLQTHIQNMYYLLLFHCKNGCTNAPQCYVYTSSPVVYTFTLALSEVRVRCAIWPFAAAPLFCAFAVCCTGYYYYIILYYYRIWMSLVTGLFFLVQYFS